MAAPSHSSTNQATFSSAQEAERAVGRLATDQLEGYRRQSRELVSHANREQSAVLGYRGRQVLELLQNADDAADDGSGEGKLLVAVSASRLVAANTGTPFSRRGLESLVISDCSPKQLDRNRFIGCKGLGFRSVLTWTDRPVIISGHLRVAFAHDHANRQVDVLAQESSEVAEAVQEFQKAEGRPPAPLMRFPFVPEADNPDVLLADRYIREGYTTVVVLPFVERTQENVASEVEEQLAHLSTETILFCRHLTEVRIDAGEEKTWEILRQQLDDERMRVVVSDSQADQLWTVHRRQGMLAADPGSDDLAVDRDYETAVAVPEHPVRKDDRTLCVFFPTHDAAPLPVVLHATLELGDDRNRIRDTPANRTVLEHLGQHLAQVVGASVDPDSPKRALRLLDGLPDVDPELARLGFVSAVVTHACKQSIFPRINGVRGPADEAVRAPHDAWRPLLIPDYFPEVLDVRSEDGLAQLLKLFGIGWYDTDVLQERLKTQVLSMPPEDAGRMVGRLAASDRLHWTSVGELLIARSGELLDEATQCFFTPTTPLPDVPEWAGDIEFLQDDFQEGLFEGAKSPSVRALSGLLQTRGAEVEEYRLETVARALLGHLQGFEEEKRPALVRDLLRWLFDASVGEPPALGQVKIPVVDVGGSVRRPEECYLGTPYPGGKLLVSLYGDVPETAFVADPIVLGLGGIELRKVEDFLVALGVSRVPRLKPLNEELLQDFAATVLDLLDYPTTVRGVKCKDASEASDLCRDFSIENLLLPEDLPQLLQRADPTALAAYLLTDGSHLLASDRDETAAFVARLNGERKVWADPSIPIPNPTLHFLRSTTWVPGDDDKLHRPSEIILSAAGSRVLRGLYCRHSMRIGDPAIERAGGQKNVNALLTRLGAIPSLEAIDAEALYELLLRLPVDDPGGKHAVGVYRTLLEASIVPDESPLRRKFVESGRIWSRFEGSGQYLPVDEVRYNANVTIPAVVEERIKLAELPRRKSTKVVESLFGVAPLGPADIALKLVSEGTEYDPSSEQANERFRLAVPYIYALRLCRRLDEDLRERNLLARARLRLCQKLQVDASLPDGSRHSIVLSSGGQTLLLDHELHLVGSYSRDSVSLVRFWQGVATLVAELIGTDMAAEAANVLRCTNTREMEDVVRGLAGAEADTKLAEARERFHEDLPEPDAEHPLPSPATANQGDATGEDGSEPAEPEAKEGDSRDGPGMPPDEPTTLPTGGTFTKVEGPERRTPKRRHLIVTGSGSSASGQRRGPLATESVTFLVVEAYEEAASPRRFPVRVAHIRGAGGFGCDLLSLCSEKARQRAQEEGVVEDADILRFIEVKGSSSRTGEVELTANEYDKAEKERDRYFLYRVFCDRQEDGKYELAVLQDPVHSDAVKHVTRFDLVQGSGAAWYRMEAQPETPYSGEPPECKPQRE